MAPTNHRGFFLSLNKGYKAFTLRINTKTTNQSRIAGIQAGESKWHMTSMQVRHSIS
nr:MAG TPA: hypothetical protein [Caudoviricetes sp.]